MSEIPSAFLNNPKSAQLCSLNSLRNLYDKINQNTFNLAEKLFDHLINVNDADLFHGKIPYLDEEKNSNNINGFIRILNDLFPLSQINGAKIIKRETIEYLNKKSFVLAMCFDGGESLDILCEVVNEENTQRIPSRSPQMVNSLKQINTNYIRNN